MASSKKGQRMLSGGQDGSRRAYSGACRVIAGGVNSPVRAFGGVDAGPLFIARGRGDRVWDIDGNEYIDYVCSWGALILGHCDDEVVSAVKAAAQRGTTFGAPTEAETELAERIVGAFGSIEKLRLVSSGTEAVMTALRLARAFTGRDLIVKMAGCYHGHSDSMLIAAGSGPAELGVPSSAGVPKAVAGLTIAVPYNDLESVRQVFARHRGKVAAVLVEPVAANMGVVPPQAGYLQGLREICGREGAILVFDEVITGFRVAYGGAQELYGIKADLTCLGKIAGGGMPLAAIGGRREIMDLLAPSGPVYQAGTLSGNPIATAAANATLKHLALPGCFEKLEELGAALQAGLAGAAAKAKTQVVINRVGSLLSCFFTAGPVRNFEDVQGTDIGRFKRFFGRMLNEGIYLAPSAYEAMFISLAHSREDIDKTVQAAYNSFEL